MARKTSILHELRWDLLILAILLLMAGLYALLDEPYLNRAEEAETGGSRPPERSEGDVLLLLPDAPGAVAQNFPELDCSYAWYNTLWQEFGTFGTALTRALNPELLAGRSVVVVPRRVAASMPANGINALADFVRDGGQLLLEMPGPGWEGLSGVSATRDTRVAQRITSVEGFGIHGAARKHLPDTPLTGSLQMVPPAAAFPGGPVLLEVDGQPGWIVNQLGDGHVYTFLFDFGCSITAMQQGEPSRQMRFGPRGAPAGPIPAAARIADERLRSTRVPYADLLERMIFRRLSRDRPLPRLWSFPGTSAGAVMVSHPTPHSARTALGFADWARRRGGRTTVFVAPDRLNAEQAVLFEESAADLGLLWIRGHDRDPVFETYGLGALEPLARELDLVSQLELFRARLPGRHEHISVARVERGAWDNDWSRTFERLAAAKIRLDHSFGPHDDEQYGYLFGTGLPFFPMDRRGLLLPMLELPYLLHGPSLTPERLDTFLGDSRAYFHQAIAVSIPSHAMATEPSPGILLGLDRAVDLASQYNHWLCTVTEFVEFTAARRRSILTSQWSAEQRRLTISVHVFGARVASREEGAFPGVAVPRAFDGREITRVVLDDREVPLRALVTTGPSFEQIVQVGPGRHNLSIYYGETPDGRSSDDTDNE